MGDFLYKQTWKSPSARNVFCKTAEQKTFLTASVSCPRREELWDAWRESLLSSSVWNRLRKMNGTLFACGLRKSVELKDGKLYDITETLEKTVKLNSTTVKCEHCDKSFKGQQYLDSHVQFKHPTFTKHCKQNSNRQSSESTNRSTIVLMHTQETQR